MRPSAADLSSLATALGELATRITVHAEEAAGAGDEDLATELFAVERALAGARRRLARAVTTARP
jgi:hypothetical protein